MKSKYLGDLTKHIPTPTYGLLATNEEIAEATKSIQHEKYRKMILLFDAHNVTHGDWESLCFALATTHVTGFKFAEKKGVKTKWDMHLRAELVLAVEETGIKNISEATKNLAKIEPWKSLVTGAERLREQYNRADAKWVNILREVRMYRNIVDNKLSEVVHK